MKNILFVCNTYFQLIVAVQLKLTLFSNDSVTLILSNHSNNSGKVFKSISDMNFFEHCFYIEVKQKSRKKTLFQKVNSLISYTFGDDSMWETMGINIQDEIIYYGQGDEIYSLFSYLYRKNNMLKVSRMEEGILSYSGGLSCGKRTRISKSIRHFMRKKSIDELYHSFYCFYPEFYKGNMNPVKIPTIDNRLGEVLTQLFNVKISLDEYKEKYIFFSSVYDFEGGEPIGELDLIKQIAKLVGKENLLVKIHPRDNKKRFIEEGLKVDANSSVPWEVIQLGRDFSKHVFMTANSTSVLSVSLLQEKTPKVIYLYKLCRLFGNAALQNSVQEIESLVQMDFVKKSNVTIAIAENIDTILE